MLDLHAFGFDLADLMQFIVFSFLGKRIIDMSKYAVSGTLANIKDLFCLGSIRK